MSYLSSSLGARIVHRYKPRWSHYLRSPVLGFASRRSLASSSSPPPPPPTDYTKLKRLEDANPERIKGIQINPDSVGKDILPGNLVYRKYKWSGNTRKIPLELKYGYFWMMTDLQKTDKKPTLSNESLISEEEAQVFPVLTGLKTLNKEKADLPFFLVDKQQQHGKSFSFFLFKVHYDVEGSFLWFSQF
jgi:hypothetical protein